MILKNVGIDKFQKEKKMFELEFIKVFLKIH